MKSIGAAIATFLTILFIGFGVTWIVQGNDFFMYKVFGIQYENTRREIFEHSEAYRQGMIQELSNMEASYLSADPAHQAALRTIIIRRAEYFGIDKLPPDLRAFVQKLKNGEV